MNAPNAKTIAAEIKKLKHALTLEGRWSRAAREQIEGDIEVLENRMTPAQVEGRWYQDETAEEYSEGDNDLWARLDRTARWLAGEKDYKAPSTDL